jgi:hypothetical protein
MKSARWLKAHGGIAAVAGPIRLVEWPEDQLRNATSPPGLQFFAVDIKVMGRKPPKEPVNTPPAEGVRRFGTFEADGVKKSAPVKKSA